MSSAPTYLPRYTTTDYELWEGDWELWDGHAVAMSPAPNVRHQRVAKQLLLAIQDQLDQHQDCHCEVLYEVDWRIKDDTVFRPDLVVVCEPIETPWLEKPPSLIVEVLSPSTEKNDRGYKRKRYAELGVGYYLVVDPEAQQIETLQSVDHTYQPAEPTELTLNDGCTINLDTASIWI